MNRELNGVTIKAVLGTVIYTSIIAFVFFACAGRTDITGARVFFIINVFYYLLPIGILFKFNPELLIHRMKRGKDSKMWDNILVRALLLTGIHGVVIVAGLDTGRYNWSYIPAGYALVGYFLYVSSYILTIWAMVVNKYFEPMVRIQKDRDHKVVKDGPYKYIRHPGYLGMFFWLVSVPLILRSVYSFIPAVVAIILLILRTYLEDKTLISELDGYYKYTEEVTCKLLPGIW